jgi:hypothetical protein
MLLATLQDFANGSPLCDDVSLTVIHRDAKCTDIRNYLPDDPVEWQISRLDDLLEDGS